jgi:Bacteriophage tail sheath protein
LVTSWLEYQRVFGSYFGVNKYLPYAVRGFFDNGGQRCFIGRVVNGVRTGADTEAASATAKLKAGGANALTLEAVGEGTWGNRVLVKVTPGTFGGFRLSVFYWKEAPSNVYDPESDFASTPRPSISEAFDDLSVMEASPDYYEKRVNGISNLVRLVKRREDSGAAPEVHSGTAQFGGEASIALQADRASNQNDAYTDMWIEITGGTGRGQVRGITDYDGDSKTATVDSNWTPVPDNTSTYQVYQLVSLSGGSDGTGAITSADYERTDTDEPGKRKGLIGFAEIDEISIVYAPNASDIDQLVSRLITHCETLKDRFAIIDVKQGSTNLSAPDLNPRNRHDTKYTAYYYPWIKVLDADTGMLRLVPPGGHMAGIYARTDAERGVYKAPANEIVRGAQDLEFCVTAGEQAILNPRGVNVIRAFPGRGIRVWGARTLSSDTNWKYINVRRLIIFIEESIAEGTQYVVFEPNDERLWKRVIQTVTQFLTRVWKDGALIGRRPEDAFFVKCDRTTMTQDDIDNGRLICIIGLAPVKPAEFVIFRIAQVKSGADITEL